MQTNNSTDELDVEDHPMSCVQAADYVDANAANDDGDKYLAEDNVQPTGDYKLLRAQRELASSSRRLLQPNATRGITKCSSRDSSSLGPIYDDEDDDDSKEETNSDHQRSARMHRRDSMRFLQGMTNMASGVAAMESAAWDSMVHQLEKDLGQLDEDGHFDAGEGVEAHSNLKIPLYAPPVQRQRWGDDQVLPHIDWGDIFFDLFYVAAAYNLGALLVSSMSRENWVRGIIYFVGIFGPLFLTWETDLFYSSRYTVVDYFHRLFELVRFIFVSFAVLHIKPLDLLADTKHSIEAFSFTLSILLESLMHLGLNYELYCRGLGDRDAIKNHSMLKIKKQLLPTCLVYFAAVISAAVLYFGAASNDYAENTTSSYGYDTDTKVEDKEYRRALAGGSSPYENSFQSKPLWELTDLPLTLTAAGYVANIVTTTIRKYRATSGKHGDIHKKFVPNNVDYLIHRYGEWIMLMIGESILSLLIVETTESHEYYIIESLGVVTVIILQLLKFESEPSHADGHALWRNIRNATCFSLLIQVLSMGLIAFGVSYKVFLTRVVTQQAEGTYRRALAAVPTIPDSTTAALFCGSLAVVLVSLELMLTTHQGVRKTYQRLFRQISAHEQALNLPLAILSIFKVFLILFQATLSSWISDPVLIVTIGFLVVTTLAVTRIVGWGLVHHERAIKEFVSNVASSSKQAARKFVQKVSFGVSSERDDNSQGRSRHSDASRRKDNKDEQGTGKDAASGASISTGKGSLNGKEDVYDEMFDAVVITDLKGSILKINQVTLDVFGYDSKKELTGRNVSILVGGGDSRHHDLYLANFREKRKTSSEIGKQRILHGKRKDGSEFPAIIGLKRSSNEKYLVGYIRDMSSISDQGHQIKISNMKAMDDRVQRVVDDTSFDCIVVSDMFGIIQSVNTTLINEFRFDEKEDLIGKNIKVLMGGGDAENHDSYLQGFRKHCKTDDKKSRVMGNQRMLKSRRQDGTEFPCILGFHKIKGTDLLVAYIRNVETIASLKTDKP